MTEPQIGRGPDPAAPAPGRTPQTGTRTAGHAAPGTPQAEPLTPRERELLDFLRAHPDRLLTRQELLLRVWGTAADQHTRTVDQHIAVLRRKCALDGRLLTVYRRGYLYRTK